MTNRPTRKPRPTVDQLLASIKVATDAIDEAFADYPVVREPRFVTNPAAPRRRPRR